MARKTRLARTLPDEHALPADTANPARSICMTCVSPFQPGAAMQLVLGKRRTPCPRKIVPLSPASMAFSRIFLICSTRLQTPFASSRAAASAAAPKPAMAATFSVPARRPISCPPPRNCAAMSVPRRTTSAPTPLGPPSLCAETSAIRHPDQLNASGSLPNACVMSLSSSPSGRSCTTPVSELASCSTECAGSVTVTRPDASTGSASLTQAATASCSIAAPCNPRPASASAAASVAPEVKITSAPSAPSAAATCARAFSTAARAARPSAWTLDGLPTISIAASIAARASGRIGAVAL